MRESLLIGVLALGNVAMWSDAFPGGEGVAARRFDGVRFERAMRRTMPTASFVNQPFAANPMIPADHVHLLNGDDRDPLSSIYVGYYPRLGVLEERPHETTVCYQSLGYAVSTPEPQRIRSGDEVFGLQRIVLRRRDREGRESEMTVFYWSQFVGGMPPATVGDRPSAAALAAARFGEGRTDLAWVRVELTGGQHGWDRALRGMLVGIMRQVCAAHRRP